MRDEILVSVVVVTYNSDKFVISTLESIKEQTYNNIELIISDDYSTDNTIPMVNKWIHENKKRFSRVLVVEGEKNCGVTANCNKGIVETTGEYIKLIAGDDLLKKDCISELLDYVLRMNLRFTYAKVMPFIETDNEGYKEKIMIANELSYRFFDLDRNKQYRELLKRFPISTIGLFLEKKFILEQGLFDEKYGMMEDYPFALKMSSQGYKLNYLDRYVAEYRVRALESRKIFYKTKRKSLHNQNLNEFRRVELLPRMKQEKMYFSAFDLRIIMLSEWIDNLNVNILFSYISKIVRTLSLSVIISRLKLWYLVRLYKRTNKKL